MGLNGRSGIVDATLSIPKTTTCPGDGSRATNPFDRAGAPVS